MLEELLHRAWTMGASDLHLAVDYCPMVRRDGSLEELPVANQRQDYLSNHEGMIADLSLSYGKKLSLEEIKSCLKQMLNPQQLNDLQEKGEVDFAITVNNQIRCRVNVYKSQNKPTFSIRFVNKKIPTCEALGLSLAVQKFVKSKNGLILVTGPTGSGKSTTLAALVQKLNCEERKHIITLEDPIEYIYPAGLSMISQRELGEDTASFASGLRGALREDPDVILVGELRDAAALRVALQAAETGHLVLSTLHTRDAVTSINRILDMLPQEREQVRAQLADCLVGIVSQELYKRKNNHGRIAAREILINNSAVSNLIREGRTHQLHSYLQTGTALGMQTMQASVALLKRQGLI